VTELIYDFAALTGRELVAALDKGGAVGMNAFRITDTQAFELFAAAAGKATAGIDATDIRERMGAVDSVKAVQLATVFSAPRTGRETGVSRTCDRHGAGLPHIRHGFDGHDAGTA